MYSIVFFFFFKQKTAYEMRISDWSSDVCSSDLMGESDVSWLIACRLRIDARRSGCRERAGGRDDDADVRDVPPGARKDRSLHSRHGAVGQGQRCGRSAADAA